MFSCKAASCCRTHRIVWSLVGQGSGIAMIAASTLRRRLTWAITSEGGGASPAPEQDELPSTTTGQPVGSPVCAPGWVVTHNVAGVSTTENRLQFLTNGDEDGNHSDDLLLL